jgi:hypothetical protein
MALTILKKPARLSFAGNDISFQVETDNYYESMGSKSNLTLQFQTPGALDGDTMTMEFGAIEILFTFKDNPTEKFHLPSTMGEDWEVYMPKLREAVYELYEISTFYKVGVSAGARTLTFQSWEKASDLAITFLTTSANISVLQNVAGGDQIPRNYYKIIGRFFMEDPTGVLVLHPDSEDRIPVDASLKATFNMRDYLKSQVKTVLNWPENDEDWCIPMPDAVKQFYFQYAEAYENNTSKLKDTSEFDMYVIPGGISKDQIAKFNEEKKDYTDLLYYNMDFLTNQPKKKIVNYMQPEKLGYIHLKGDMGIKLQMIIHYQDGSSETDYTDSVNVEQYKMYSIEISPLRRGVMTKHPDKVVDHIDYAITNTSGFRIGVTRTLYIDQDYREHERVFLFKNSYHHYDTLRTIGVTERQASYDRVEIENLHSEEDLTWKAFDILNDVNFETRKIKFNTGFMQELSMEPMAYLDYLREFSLSTEVYELVNNRLYPVILKTKKFIYHEDEEYLVSLDFEAEQAYSDKFYTKDENMMPTQRFTQQFNERFVK